MKNLGVNTENVKRMTRFFFPFGECREGERVIIKGNFGERERERGRGEGFDASRRGVSEEVCEVCVVCCLRG